MNYELGKKLKDAGFPQRKGVDGDDFRMQLRYGFPTYFCEHGNNCGNAHCPTQVYIPRLTELIQACGDEFYSLQKSVEGFAVKSRTEMRKDIHDRMEGLINTYVDTYYETPEEAISNLYLALHAKS